MSQLVPCPKCGADIESDSCYCDQCGNELMKCPTCGRFCKGKFCVRCGVPAQPASQLQGAAAPQGAQGARVFQPSDATVQPQPVQGPTVSSPSAAPVQPQPVQPQSAPVQPQPVARPTTNPPYGGAAPGTGTSIPGAAPAGPTQLVCRAMGISIPLIAGAVIGRVNGQYAPQLGICQYISGTHARLDCVGGQWTITDLGSRNGTEVNGVRCAPALPFRKGDVIRFATFYDFLAD